MATSASPHNDRLMNTGCVPPKPRQLVLASASPARLALLRSAGLDPAVVVSGVDESVPAGTGVGETVAALAARKAEAVARRPGLSPDALILGCDSMLDVDGTALGKPVDAADATARWRALRGLSAVLRTGHHLLEVAGGRSLSEVGSTTVHFGRPSEAEIASYVASGEPLAVAGAFTLDGRSSPWIDRIEGDPSTVIGLSLPVLARLLAAFGLSIVEFWEP